MAYDNYLTEADVADFMTQNICVDGNGDVVKADPAACPIGTTSVNPVPGQRVPYHKIDQVGSQAQVSFEMLTPSGEKLWVHTFDWGDNKLYLDENKNPILNQAGVDARQAYLEMTNPQSSPGISDIMDSTLINKLASANPTVKEDITDWVSISATAQNHWIDDCALKGEVGGWLLMPMNAVPNGLGVFVSKIGNLPVNESCPTAFSEANTVWSWGPQEYTNGKILDSIVTLHTCSNQTGQQPPNPEVKNSCYEKFYFTREYGMTRWESWETDDTLSRPTDPAEANPMGCNGDWESGHYWRKFCRDFAQVNVLPNTVDWNPKSYPLDQNFGKGNLIQNGDLAYLDTTGWGIYNSPSRPTEWFVREEPLSADRPANHYLEISCPGCTAARPTVYYDVIRPSNMNDNSTVSWGGDIWSDTTASATVYLYQLPVSGSTITYDSFVVSLQPGVMNKIDRQVTVDPNTHRFRWQIFINTLGTVVNVDDAFLTNW